MEKTQNGINDLGENLKLSPNSFQLQQTGRRIVTVQGGFAVLLARNVRSADRNARQRSQDMLATICTEGILGWLGSIPRRKKVIKRLVRRQRRQSKRPCHSQVEDEVCDIGC